MFLKVLVANRGEIAVRIIRALRDMGIVSVAVYSTADKEALHTQIADEAICIGDVYAKDSYLCMENIISAAICTGAEAIHPGFGFLSENAEFAKKCKDHNIAFIGPDHTVIETMGDKIAAKILAEKANVKTAPWFQGEISDINHAIEICNKINYPVMLKAAAGGGGRGIRIINCEDDIRNSFDMAKKEALANFSDDRLFIEKFIKDPKHIEVQILADTHGNVIHLYERECSVQRKRQKLIEESPCRFISDDLRKAVCESAVRLAKISGYTNAGTVEFLMDENNEFYFCEMNTRIQVEHPVTEEITGVDIVCEQIRIAFGKKLGFTQEDIKINGHAIECRINAEDENFIPHAGTVDALNLPGGIGVRVDTAIYQGYKVPPYYDSMIAKLIVKARDRDQAIAKMKRALSELLLDGIVTNTDYQFGLISSKLFREGTFTTNSVEKGEFDIG